MQVKLIVEHDSANVKTVTLGGDAIVGRGKNCNLRIGSNQISRQHCKILVDDGVVKVCDLGSSNGTYVEGKRIPANKEITLPAGCELSVGGVRFHVLYQESKKRASTGSSIVLFNEATEEDIDENAPVEPLEEDRIGPRVRQTKGKAANIPLALEPAAESPSNEESRPDPHAETIEMKSRKAQKEQDAATAEDDVTSYLTEEEAVDSIAGNETESGGDEIPDFSNLAGNDVAEPEVDAGDEIGEDIEEVEYVEEVDVGDGEREEEVEYKYVEEVEASPGEGDVEDVEYEYEYVDENGNPIENVDGEEYVEGEEYVVEEPVNGIVEYEEADEIEGLDELKEPDPPKRKKKLSPPDKEKTEQKKSVPARSEQPAIPGPDAVNDDDDFLSQLGDIGIDDQADNDGDLGDFLNQFGN